MPDGNSYTFGVKDCIIAPVLTDPSGGAMTFGTEVDVPGILSVTVGGNVSNKTLRGDNTILASRSTVSEVTATVEHSVLSLDVLAELFGGTVTQGSTDNRSYFDAPDGTTPPPFKLEAICAAGENGDEAFGLIIFKCVLASFPAPNVQDDEFSTFTFDVTGVAPIGTDPSYRYVVNDTGASPLTLPIPASS